MNNNHAFSDRLTVIGNIGKEGEQIFSDVPRERVLEAFA